MALSYIDRTGDGTTTDFTIPFNYIDRSHVHVYVNGLEVTSFTWLSDTQIRLSVAPGNTFTVRIQRITPNGARLVDFQNGSSLDADGDLDRDSNQMFFITQELVDSGVSGTAASKDTFTGSGTNTVFALTAAPTTGSTPVVTVNGVTAVLGVDYTISGQTLTFTTAVPSGAAVLVTYTKTNATSGTTTTTTSGSSDSWTYDVFTGDGSATSYVLKAPPGNLAVLSVAVAGVVKTAGLDYLLSGQTLQFLAAPAAGAVVFVRYGAPLPATAVSLVQEFRTALANQTIFLLTSTYQPGTGTMMVFVNGLVLVPGVDYTETDSATVTINPVVALSGGDSVLFIYGNPINANTVDGARLINASIDASTKLKAGSVGTTQLTTALQTQLNSATSPSGKVDWFIASTAPSGWVAANGATIGSSASGATNRANADTLSLFTALWTYVLNADLPIQDSTGAASSRGASALADFNANKRMPLPDLRGEFVRGWDNSRGVDASRNLGSWQTDQIKSHTHTYVGPGAGTGNGYGQSSSTGTTGAFGGNETRPRNVAFLACIKL